MKTLKTKRTRKIAIMACLLLAIIAGISIATDARKGIGATIAMATLVGGVTLEGKEEALYVALKTSIDSEIEKHTKGYISETKMTENINAQSSTVRVIGPAVSMLQAKGMMPWLLTRP